MRTTTAVLIALGMIVTACNTGAAGPIDTTTTTSEPVTTSTTTSTAIPPTTTTPKLDTSDINGLPVDDPALLERRVVAVKIDNHPNANPQSGIDQADMMIELMVEGITRFISVWQQSDSEYLGPNRSARPTDSELLQAFNEPTYVFSGAQAWVQGIIAGTGINTIKELSFGTFRISSRKAPHNLYVDTVQLRETADERNYPNEPPNGPIWEFGPMSDFSDPASSVNIDFSGHPVVWTWDQPAGLWLRTAYGIESNYRNEDGSEDRVGVPVMVALYVERYTAHPPSGVSGSSLPSSITTGTGKAFVFADGLVSEGTWERESELDWFKITDANGETILVPAGKIWVSLVPSNRGLTIQN
jgi:hypothetical protein